MGIDFARDAVETGLSRGVLHRLDKNGNESKQGSVTYDGFVLGRGINQAVAYLNEHPDVLAAVRGAVATREEMTRSGRRGKTTEVATTEADTTSSTEDAGAAPVVEKPKRRRASKKQGTTEGQS
jgi:hypothetical protein